MTYSPWRRKRLLESLAYQCRDPLAPARSSRLKHIWRWSLALFAPVCVSVIVLALRYSAGPLTPLVQGMLSGHPALGEMLTVIAGMSPDITTLALALLGLTYLMPGFVKYLEIRRRRRVLFFGYVFAYCLFAIVANQLSRERQDQLQATIGNNVLQLSQRQTVTPTWLDRRLQDWNLPNRLSRSAETSPLPQTQPSKLDAGVASVSSSPQYSKPELVLIRMTAANVAKELDQDYLVGMKNEDDIDEAMRKQSVEAYRAMGKTEAEAENLAGQGRVGSSWSMRQQQKPAQAARFAFDRHGEEVYNLIEMARNDVATPSSPLFGKLVDLQAFCSPVSRGVSDCVKVLSLIAAASK